MKIVPLVSSLIAAAYAAPSPAEAIGEAVEWKADAAAADPVNPLMKSSVNGEKVLPRFSMTKAGTGLKRTTVKYGSWSVSSVKMMSTVKLAQGPCPGLGCYVTAMESTIRYPDGKEANVDTGAWLHHIALFGTGTGGAGIWAAGNERPTLRLNSGGAKFGIDFPSAFMLMIDLMTEDVKAKNLTLEISYEYAPKSDSSYKGVVMHWLTIGEPQAKSGKYSFNTLPSVATTAGRLLYAIGHMHDGGTDMQLFVGGKMVCKSVMHYNAREGYGTMKGSSKSESSEKTSSSSSSSGSGLLASLFGGSSSTSKSSSSSNKSSSSKDKEMGSGHSHKMVKRQHSHGGGGGEGGAAHISDPGACTDFGRVKLRDSISATANYDANKFKLMEHNGKKEKLMGNMRVYIGPGSD